MSTQTTSAVEDEYQVGNHLYVRKDVIDLAALDATAALKRKDGQVLYLHLYCDKLIYNGPVDQSGRGILKNFLRSTGFDLQSIQIYARDFMTTSTELRGLHLNAKDHFSANELILTVVTEVVPKNFTFKWGYHREWEILAKETDCEAPSSCSRRHCILSETDVGHKLVLDNADASPATLLVVPKYEVEPLSAPDLLVFKQEYARTSNLPLLLHRLFVLAGQSLSRDEEEQDLARSRLRFIRRCTKGSAANVNLALDAKTLLSRIELPRSSARLTSDQQKTFFVPKFDTKEYIEQAKSDINAVTALSSKIEAGAAHQELVQLLIDNKTQTGDLWKGLGLMVRTTVRDSELNWSRASKALLDVQSKIKDLEQRQGEADTACANFQDKLNSYIHNKEVEAERERIIAGLKIGFAVVGCIATSGASAPATIGSVSKIVDGTFKPAGKLEALGRLLIKIAYKVGPLANKLKTVFGKQKEIEPVISKTLKEIRAKAAQSTSDSALTQNGSSVDVLGLLADWEEFKIDLDLMLEQLEKDVGTDGPVQALSEYKAALLKQVVRGKTLVLAARDSQEALEYFLKQEAEYEARDKREQELKSLGSQLRAGSANSAQITQIVGIMLKQELTASKRRLFVNLHRGLLSLVFRTNNPYYLGGFVNKSDSETSFSPDMDMGSFTSLRDRIVNAMLADDKSAQTFSATVDMRYFHTEWKDLLVKSGRIPFEIRMDLENARDYYRARILTVKASFKGLTAPLDDFGAPKRLHYTLEFGPHMKDRDETGEVVEYWTEPQILQKDGDDNEWIDNGLYISPTLFSSGSIWISAKNNPGFDLTQIEKVSLILKCRGMAIGPSGIRNLEI